MHRRDRRPAGIKPEVAAITVLRDARRNRLLRESRRAASALLAGLHVTTLEARLQRPPHAVAGRRQTLLDGFAKVGAKTLLVSGGFTFFTERLKSRLRNRLPLANELEIADGELTGRVIRRDRAMPQPKRGMFRAA